MDNAIELADCMFVKPFYFIKMIEENFETNFLVHQLYRKLTLVEVEKKVIEISCSLMNDEIYSIEDAVDALMQVIDLIEMERQGITSDIESSLKKTEKVVTSSQ